MDRNNIFSFDTFFVLLCYTTAAIYGFRELLQPADHGNAHLQTFFLLGLCILSSIWLLFNRNPIFKAALLILISIMTLVCGGLQGPDIALEVLTLTALNSLLVRSYAPAINLSAAALVLSASVITQKDMLVLGVHSEGPESQAILFLILSQFLFLLLFNRIRLGRAEEMRLLSDLKAREKTISHLTDANRDFQKFAIDVEEESRSDERNRVTRDIHDITGYTMTGVSMLLEHAQDLLSVERYGELNELLDTAKTQTRKGHEEIRVSLKKLRSIDDYENFYSAVLQIVRNFETATGVKVEADFTNMSLTMGKFGQTVLFRFLQEGMTNAFRHGNATRISIMFFQEHETLVASLEDNGSGADIIEEGIGLKGMSERISKLKGEVSYGSTSLGFTLRARIPLESLRPFCPKVKKHKGSGGAYVEHKEEKHDGE